ncbi:MAG: Hsp20/alpha crystallin family protein [Spirochaetia bacterium]|jgi:HSP20 family protein|nr:Hsp20/alpha crystallin family protein [Spirochaetia bacterium]
MRNNVNSENKKYYKACCDIYEKNGQLYLELEMPGVSKENLEMKIENDMLYIHGKKNINNNNKDIFLLKEIRDGDYHHEYTIDNTIDRNKIEATLSKGVATIVMGIKESEKPRKIAISGK